MIDRCQPAAEFSGRSGVYQTGRLAAVGEAITLAAEAGVPLALIHGDRVRSKSDLLAEIADALAFPAYVGKNWDALEEALRNLSWRTGCGAVIVWMHPDALLDAAPEAWETAVAILRDVADYWAAEGGVFALLAVAPGRDLGLAPWPADVEEGDAP